MAYVINCSQKALDFVTGRIEAASIMETEGGKSRKLSGTDEILQEYSMEKEFAG